MRIFKNVDCMEEMIAFEGYGLQYVGYEKDKKYYDMARLRIEEQRTVARGE